MNVAARLEQSADPDEVLISAATHRLVHDAVQVEEADHLELKGRGERVQAYRLLKVDPSALGFARRLTAPMVGRDRELSLLRAAFDRAVSDRACQLFTVLGVGGVGKSRLLGAFVDELGAARDRPAGSLSPVRRRHHVLADHRGDPAGRRALGLRGPDDVPRQDRRSDPRR